MSAAFKPNKGDRFYVSFKPHDRIINDLGGGFLSEAKVVQQIDRSYAEDVFECIGCDETLIVGKILTRGNPFMEDLPIRLRISECTFAPVGPEVIEALGLGEKP